MELYTFDLGYVQRLKNGDPATEQHFVSYFSALILIKLRSRFLAKDVIDDLRQETFVRVLALVRKDDAIDHPERLGALVNSVCNNVLLEHYRASSRTEGFAEDFDPPDKTIDMDRTLVSREAQEQVAAVLAEMSERDRRVLRELFLEEKEKDTVCRAYGVDRDYLRVLVHRAKLQFREVMQKKQRRAVK